jgi:hypothetical protein
MLSMVQIDDDELGPFSVFSALLFYYSSRTLTFQSDGLNAFAGISQRLAQRYKCRLLQGIPVSSFELYQVFQAAGALLRRGGFPSWSWAGWIGHLDYGSFDPDENDWLANNTWIVWYERSTSGVVSPVLHLPASPNLVAADAALTRHRTRRPFQYPGQLTNSWLDTSHTAPSRDPLPDVVCRPYPMLQFWTMAGFYTVSESPPDSGRVSVEHQCFDVYDVRRRFCGFLLTDSARVDIPSYHMIELAILASHDEGMNTSRFDKKQVGQNGGLYWALQIEWDKGVAERRGICQIYRDALEWSFKPGPVWKEVVLG